jgi:hypothetical protein
MIKDIQRKDILSQAQEIERYLNFNSLARKVLCPEDLPQGDMRFLKYEKKDDLSDIFGLTKIDNVYKILTGNEMLCKIKIFEDELQAPEIECCVKIDDEGFLSANYGQEEFVLSAVMPEKIFNKMKIKFLNEEENIFLNFVKKHTQNVGRYICCKNEKEAIKEIRNKDYKSLWIGKKFAQSDVVQQLPHRQSKNSSNLNGFILVHEGDLHLVGLFLISDRCIIPSIEEKKFIAFEHISILLTRKGLTYIEINEKS